MDQSSYIKGVMEYMAAMPGAKHHEDLYLEHMEKMRQGGGKTLLVVPNMEQSTWSSTERNILKGCRMPYQFVKQGFFKKGSLTTMALAKQHGSESGLSSLKKSKVIDLDYTSSVKVSLKNRGVDLIEYSKGNIVADGDIVTRGRITAACPNLSGVVTNDILITCVGEKLLVAPDMRHMLLKGYLYLCDYNLAVTSGVTKRCVAKNDVHIESDCNGLRRLKVLANTEVVIDTVNFTSDELNLLALMAGQYPSVKYCYDNIYNQMKLLKDDVTFISSGKCVIEGDTSFESPERMYQNLINIACKLGAFEQLREVIHDMRGVPYLLKIVGRMTGKKVYHLSYPGSRSIASGMGEIGKWNDWIGVPGNFFATSVSLISDMLLGQAMVSQVYTLAEHLGMLSKVGCPSGDIKSDLMVQGRLRENGLSNDDKSLNVLMMEWRLTKGCSLPFGFDGGLKELVVAVAAAIDEAKNCKDLFIPQIMLEVVGSQFSNTTWAACRGVDIIREDAGVDREIHAQNKKHMFAWVMGVSERIPKVGLAEIGQRQHDILEPEENEWFNCAEGNYKVVNLDYNISGDYEGRTDEMEVTAVNMYKSYYTGSRSVVILDATGAIRNLSEVIDDPKKPSGKDTIGGSKGDLSDVSDDESEKGDDFEDDLNFADTDQTAKEEEKKRRKRERDDKRNDERRAERSRRNVEREKVNRDDKEARNEKYKMKNDFKIKINKASKPSSEWKSEQEKHFKINMSNGVPPPQDFGSADPTDYGLDFKYDVVKARGDGLCGLHAICSDLLMRGYIPKEHISEVRNMFRGEVRRNDWYSPEELGYMITQLGMGLEVYQTNSTPGGGEQRKCHAFGIDNASHIIRLVYTGGRYGHYDLMVPNSKGCYRWKSDRPKERQSPADAFENLHTNKWMFDFWDDDKHKKK